MKTRKFAALFIAGLSIVAGNAWPNPVDLSAPSGELGAANSRGYLEIWSEIDGVGLQLDKDSYLPLRFKFSSEPNTGGMLGPGFYCPMFEARNVLIRESTMRAYLPCGKGLYLWRDTLDPNKFQTPDGQWSAYLMPSNDLIVWRDDGWKILYHASRLSSLTSDDGHTFTWDYSQPTMPYVSEDGHPLISVEANPAGQVAAFVANGKRYAVEYAERPITEMLLGQVAIKELDQALSSFQYPDGRTERFKFILTPDRTPTLAFTDTGNQQTLYTWDAASSYLATEKGPQGNWTYKVGAIAQDFGLPPVSRTDDHGKTEGMSVDNTMGAFTTEETDNSTTVTHVFETPGPLFHKVKSIEKTINGVTTAVYRASYDEDGRLIREVDAKVFSVHYTYDTNGNLTKRVISIPSDPKILLALQKQETALLAEVAAAPTPRKKEGLLEKLAFFYIHDTGHPEKALTLLPQISVRQLAFNVQLHAIDGDVTLSGQQKADKFEVLEKQYPEEKKLLDLLIKVRPQEDRINNETQQLAQTSKS